MTKKIFGIPAPVVYVIAAVLVLMLLYSLIGGPIGSKLLAVFGIDFKLPEWAQIETPHPELAPEAIFQIGSLGITNTMITAWMSIIFLIIISLVITSRMKLVPGRLQSLLEYAISSLLNLCESIAGPKYGRQVFPVVATIFLFVFVNAWTSLIPGFGSITIEIHNTEIPLFRGANTDINLPLALALISFFTTWFFAFKASGLKYLGTFFQFKKIGQGLKLIFTGKLKSGIGTFVFGIIDLLVGLLELLSVFIRLISFTFRLFGNMTAGEILLLSISFLVPWVLSIVFYGLEMLVGFVQALAFSMLTIIFTAIAVAGHEEEEHHEELKTQSN